MMGRRFVLKAFKEIEEKSKENTNQEGVYKTKLADIIGTVTMVLENGDTELQEEEIEKIIQINIEKGKEEAKKQKRAKRQEKGTNGKSFFGDTFNFDFFKDVSALIEYEPVNEMGVVALFCIMFQSLRGKQFEWKNEILKPYRKKIRILGIYFYKKQKMSNFVKS